MRHEAGYWLFMAKVFLFMSKVWIAIAEFCNKLSRRHNDCSSRCIERAQEVIRKYAVKRLVVSYDCGCSYQEVMRSTSEMELLDKAAEMKLDEQWLRWAIEDVATNDVYEVGSIHKKIISNLKAANS